VVRRVLATALLVLLTAGVSAAAVLAAGRDEPKPGEARLSLRAPVVAEHRASAVVPWSRSSDSELLPAGELVRVVSGGEAGLALAHGVRLSLPVGGELTVGVVPELTAGKLLVETAGSVQAVKAGESSFTVARSSAARLHRSLDAGTAVYAGRVDIASAGRRLAVPALRSASVPALGLVPSSASPLVLDPGDGWDVRFLGLAMDLAAQLDAGSAGFSAQAPSVDQASLLSLVPGAVGDGGLLRGRRTGDQLVAAVIAASAPGGFSARLPSVVGFRDEGASWGLVVLDQAGGQRGRVVSLVRAAIADWLGRSGGFGLAAAPSFAAAAPSGPTVASTPPPSSGSSPAATTPLLPTTPPVTTPSPPTSTPTVTIPGPPVTTPAPAVTVPPVRTGTPIDDVIDAIGL
jgi:hypothetical protein